MTVRRRSGRAVTPAQIARRIPTELHKLPPVLPIDGLAPHEANLELTNGYRLYMDELEHEVYSVTRRGGWGEAVAVAGVLGTDPASWYRAVFRGADASSSRP